MSAILSFPDFIHQDLQAIHMVLRERLNSDVVLIQHVADYIVASGGKRLRPMVLMLMGRALGASCSILKKMHVQAAMIECIHTATLLHDDVVDSSDMRRGKPTANATFGNAASVLVGDFLYTRAFELMVDAENMGVLQLMAKTTNHIAEGEVLQLLHIGQLDLSLDQYMSIIEQKTAKLFQASAQVPAILLDMNQEIKEACASYGRFLGTAFQIADDILDYSSDVVSLGKNPGDDLAEGKLTLPLLYALNSGDSRVIACIRSALERKDRCLFPEVRQMIIDSGALNQSIIYAQNIVRKAQSALNILPESAAKKTLFDLAQYAVQRPT